MSEVVLPSGHTAEIISGAEDKRLKDMFCMYRDGVLRVKPEGWIFPKPFIEVADRVYNFKLRSDDVFVTTFPKSGTSWTQEMVWTMLHNRRLDNPDATWELDARSPNVGCDMFFQISGAPPVNPDSDPVKHHQKLCPELSYEGGYLLNIADHTPTSHRRVLKSHVPFEMLPPKLLDTCKVIYVARDPRDVYFSNLHFTKLQKLWGLKGSDEEYFEEFLGNHVPFSPYWNHMKQAWHFRNHPNMLFLYFEDLKSDPTTEMHKINDFIQAKLTDKEIEGITNFTSFSVLKERSLKNSQPCSGKNTAFDKEFEKKNGGFFRKGNVGDWKNRFSTEQQQRIDAWINNNLEVQMGPEFTKYKVEAI